MNALLKFRRQLERQSAELLGQIHRQILDAAEQAVQRLFNIDRLPVPVPVRVVKPGRFDRS